MLLGLLYSTSIRIGEAFALNLNDFHCRQQALYIAEGKFRKARWVPLHPSTSQALEQYIHRRLRTGPKSSDSPLFINLRACRLCHCTVHSTFRQLLENAASLTTKTAARVSMTSDTPLPVHRLLAWYRDGQDVNARLPALATYMGHVDVTSTQVYLHPTAELLEQVSNRFHSHYLHNVKPKGGR